MDPKPYQREEVPPQLRKRKRATPKPSRVSIEDSFLTLRRANRSGVVTDAGHWFSKPVLGQGRLPMGPVMSVGSAGR